MGKFTGARLDVIEYDLTEAPHDFRPDPDAPDSEIRAWLAEGGMRTKLTAKAIEAEREKRRRVCAEGRWAGVIPEPSQDAVKLYFDRLQSIRYQVAQEEQEVQRQLSEGRRDRWKQEHPDKLDEIPSDEDLIYGESPEQLRANLAMLQSARSRIIHEQRNALAHAVDEFTQGTPGADVVEYLGYRALENFLGWLSGHFSPEAVGAASTL